MSVATYYTSSPGPLADGGTFRASAMACASRVYPLHTRLELTSRSGRRVIVTVRDRTGRGRTNIDLTPGAMRRLAGPGYRRIGALHVRVRQIGIGGRCR